MKQTEAIAYFKPVILGRTKDLKQVVRNVVFGQSQIPEFFQNTNQI